MQPDIRKDMVDYLVEALNQNDILVGFKSKRIPVYKIQTHCGEDWTPGFHYRNGAATVMGTLVEILLYMIVLQTGGEAKFEHRREYQIPKGGFEYDLWIRFSPNDEWIPVSCKLNEIRLEGQYTGLIRLGDDYVSSAADLLAFGISLTGLHLYLMDLPRLKEWWRGPKSIRSDKDNGYAYIDKDTLYELAGYKKLTYQIGQ
jgi:hypothetical protein